MSVMASQINSLTITQPFIQAQNKQIIKALHHWLCEENTPVTGEFPAQRTSNAEKASIWWRDHDINNDYLTNGIKITE